LLINETPEIKNQRREQKQVIDRKLNEIWVRKEIAFTRKTKP